jgi:hypothetical protein
MKVLEDSRELAADALSSWQVLAVQEKTGPWQGTGVWKMPTGIAIKVGIIGGVFLRERLV